MTTLTDNVTSSASSWRRAPLTAALIATGGLVLVLFWQAGRDAVVPFDIGALQWLARLTPLDRRLFGILALLGAAGWAWAVRRDDAPVDRSPMPVAPGPRLDRRRLRALLAGLGLVLFTAVVGQFVFGPEDGFVALIDYSESPRVSNSLTTAGLIMWLGGTALFLWALADRGGRWRALLEAEGATFTVTRTAVLVGLITLVAGYFRFHDLAGLPYEMTSDHTEKLLDVAEVLAGQRPVFMPLNAGREPMQFYLTALLVRLGLPLSFLTLKAGMALVSTLTVPLVYGLGRVVAGRRVGLLAALILALAPWHLQITRIALRIPLSPFFVALTLALAYRALSRGRRNDWLAVGLAMGLGMYGYSGFRPMAFAVPILVAIRLGHDAWGRRSRGEPLAILPAPLAAHMAASVGAALLVATPLLRYALDEPTWFWGRTLSRISGAEQALERPAWEQFLLNWKNALLMFNVTSDSAWFHSPVGRPALETVGGALLILGVVTALVRVWRGDWRLAGLLVIVPVMLVASVMAIAFPLEVPHLTRAAGALPAIVVLAALPLVALWRLWRQSLGAVGDGVFLLIAVVLLVFMSGNTTERVFGEYRAGYDGASHPTREGAAVARAFLELGGELEHVFLVSWPHGWDFRALGIEMGDPEWHNVLEGAEPDMSDSVLLAEMHQADPQRKLYLVGGPAAQANIDYLLTLYPDAFVSAHTAQVESKNFWSVLVPPADDAE